MSSVEESCRVVSQWVESADEGRFDELMALGAPGATWWVSGLKETSPLTGTYPYAEREKHFKELLKDATSFTFTVKGISTEGDIVVVEGELSAESQDGGIYVNDDLMKFVVKDGKIQSVREYINFVSWEPRLLREMSNLH